MNDDKLQLTSDINDDIDLQFEIDEVAQLQADNTTNNINVEMTSENDINIMFQTNENDLTLHFDGYVGSGEKGESSYTYVRYSPNENGEPMFKSPNNETEYFGIQATANVTASTNPSDYIWAKFKGEKGEQGLRGLQGEDGERGIAGEKGEDGRTSFFHIKYSAVANPTTSSQMSETPNVYIGTYVDYEEEDSNEPSKYTWCKFQGLDGSQGIPGANGSDGKTSYLHIAYSNSADGSKDFSIDDSTDRSFIGQYTDFIKADSTDYKKYVWSLIKGDKGDKGDKGEQGVQGPKGDDGEQLYTWLKYADSPTAGMSDSPTNKAYIGLAYNKTTATESSNYGDYSWSLVKGEQGDTGVQGPKGADGKTTYTWIKYATSSTGANMSDEPSGKTYIGLAYNKNTATESTIASDYTWSLIKGDKGDKGDDGTVHSDTEPTDKTKLWLDTSLEPPLLKYWDGTSWEAVNDFAENINNAKQTITTEYNSAINQLKESLTILVEKLQTTTTDNVTLIEQLSSQIVQNASSISLITNSVNSINDNISGLATKEEISQWARFQGGVLELGASNSPFAVKLSNTELGFYQNGSRIAYLSNQQLNIEFAIVMTKLNIGIFSWSYDSVNGLTLT